VPEVESPPVPEVESPPVPEVESTAVPAEVREVTAPDLAAKDEA
jgi:hypothetical protein